MSTANQRIPVLVTATEKSQIAKRAKKAGFSMGEYFTAGRGLVQYL